MTNEPSLQSRYNALTDEFNQLLERFLYSQACMAEYRERVSDLEAGNKVQSDRANNYYRELNLLRGRVGGLRVVYRRHDLDADDGDLYEAIEELLNDE